MTFNIDFTRIDGYEDFHADERELDISYALAWSSLVTGISAITDANAADVQERFNTATDVFGAFLSRTTGDGTPPVPVYVSLQDVQRRAGLRTNASPRSKAQFDRAVVQELRLRARNR